MEDSDSSTYAQYRQPKTAMTYPCQPNTCPREANIFQCSPRQVQNSARNAQEMFKTGPR